MNNYLLYVLSALMIASISIPGAGATTFVEFAQRVQGRLLIDVDHNGQAWYVDPLDYKRYDIGDWQAGFALMRAFGLGIANDKLSTIPIGIDDKAGYHDSDGDGLPDVYEKVIGSDPTSADTNNDGINDGQQVRNNTDPTTGAAYAIDKNLVNKLKGRILLQVQAHGEAWYVNPKDGKRYYIKDGVMLWNLVTHYGLGARGSDVLKVPQGITPSSPRKGISNR